MSTLIRSLRRRRPLPRPGTVLGAYPMRETGDTARRGTTPRWRQRRAYREMARTAAAQSASWLARPVEDWPRARQRLVGKLGRDGLTARTIPAALGCVAAHLERALGLRCFDVQLQCAAALLDQRAVEMATGEGKTLAAALAAAAAAMAGIPVHVITANDYLARRDAGKLAPLYSSLDLRVVGLGDGEEHGADQYAADVVYATARTIAFDHLRDQSQCDRLDNDALVRTRYQPSADVRASRLKLRGLCMALIDELDSILIDEALTPLILSASHADPDERAQLWLALDWAKRLGDGDFVVDVQARRARLTDSGKHGLRRDRDEYPGLGLNDLHRAELIEHALSALHVLRRGVDYVVDDGQVLIVDPVTGRSVPGRQWSRGLHGLIALKEGLEPPDPTSTVARTLYQQFFSRYHHLCGLSGTLREVRRELRRDYQLSFFAVPLRQTSRRQHLPPRVFADRESLFEAALDRAIAKVRTEQRAVLLTTDSIDDTLWFAQRLAETDVPHAVLNAISAEQEADIIAQAGLHARVTVATQMAGRGTDILLSEAVRLTGGLHVLNIQHNRSRRVDRQIAGRAARQGEPGSYEHWRSLQVSLSPLSSAPASRLSRLLMAVAHRALGRPLVTILQRSAEGEDAAIRQRMFSYEKKLAEGLLFSRQSG